MGPIWQALNVAQKQQCVVLGIVERRLETRIVADVVSVRIHAQHSNGQYARQTQYFTPHFDAFARSYKLGETFGE